MSQKSRKIIAALILLVILTMLLSSCTNEQAEDVAELVLQSGGCIDENRFLMYI